MGRLKTLEEKTHKRLAKIEERKLLELEAQDRANVPLEKREKIIRRRPDPLIPPMPIKQKKG